MTHKQRFLSAVRMEPVDRLPFWPKIFDGYMKHQASAFGGKTLREAYRFFDSDPQFGLPEFIIRTGKKSSVEIYRDNDTTVKEFRLGKHSRKLVMKHDPVTLTSHPVEFPIITPEDLDFMAEWYSDGKFHACSEQLEKQRLLYEDAGEDAAFAYFIGESPLMYFLEYLAGIENGHYLLYDYPEKTEALFAEIHRELLDCSEIAAENPYADMLYFAENTSTTLISPVQYVRYCKTHIAGYAERIKPSGKPLLLHMCGHLKGLLDILSEAPAAGFEAFTPPTVGNTTLLDGRVSCPGKSLIGGTNAVIWLWEPGKIIDYIYGILDSLPHTNGIVISPAGVMPPAASPETINVVCEAVKSYRVRNRS